MNSTVKYLPDPFVIGLFGMMALAYFLPAGPAVSEWLHTISEVGIWLIFFFYGMKIPKATLRTNLVHWRLHLAIQLTTFLIFPLVLLALKPWLFQGDFSRWWPGFWFLAAIPSTVSSSVVMVALAKGNVPGALFNATLSGLIGVLVTPLWLSGEIPTDGVLTLYGDLLGEVVVPTILGLLLQPWGGKWVQSQAKRLAWMDKTTIWMIVYLSFTHTFQSNLWKDIVWSDLVWVALITVGIFIAFFVAIRAINRLAHWFSREDEIAWMFCGSKKSLVHGSVFLPILFPDQPVGLLLLPLMFYHAWQLILVSYVATYWGKQA